MTSNTRTLNDVDRALAQLHDRVVGSSPVGHTLTHAIPVAIELKNQGGAQ